MKEVIIIVFTLFSLQAYSSDSIPSKKITYKTKLVTLNGRSIDGYLGHLDDSTVYTSGEPIVYGSTDVRDKNKFSYSEISEVTLRRKGSAGRGLLFGTIGGALFGALVGLITYQKPNCDPDSWFCIDFGPGYSALGGGMAGAVGGGLIGCLIGATAKKNFPIGGNKEKFDSMKISVLERAYGKKP